jgi:hypothetical protein
MLTPNIADAEQQNTADVVVRSNGNKRESQTKQIRSYSFNCFTIEGIRESCFNAFTVTNDIRAAMKQNFLKVRYNLYICDDGRHLIGKHQ